MISQDRIHKDMVTNKLARFSDSPQLRRSLVLHAQVAFLQLTAVISKTHRPPNVPKAEERRAEAFCGELFLEVAWVPAFHCICWDWGVFVGTEVCRDWGVFQAWLRKGDGGVTCWSQLCWTEHISLVQGTQRWLGSWWKEAQGSMPGRNVAGWGRRLSSTPTLWWMFENQICKKRLMPVIKDILYTHTCTHSSVALTKTEGSFCAWQSILQSPWSAGRGVGS